MKKERLRIENLKKDTLLQRIEFQVFEGEIIHCVFDNIQEKNMFLRVLTGKEQADYGKVYYNEKEVNEKKVLPLFKKRMAIISRESNLIESVSLEENIFLIRPGAEEQWISRRKYRKKSVQLFEQFDLHINIDTPMKKLSQFEKVQVEILKAYLTGRQIIILTSLGNSLSSSEMKRMMKLLDRLRRKGISFVIIEPLEDMDFTYVDTVVIIKHGRTSFVRDADDCDYLMLHTILYYDEMEKRVSERMLNMDIKEERQSFEIHGMSSGFLKNISISVNKGEILKLYCIDEKSYEEITGVFQGASAIRGGSIISQGKKKEIRKVLKGLEDGIGIVQGNPAKATLFPELSVMDNLQMLLSKKACGIWMIPKYRRSIRLLLKDIIPRELFKKKIKELAPADIQKVLYCRWFLYSPELLVCIQPFAEGDIQARETARKMIYILKERKIPILIITSNTAELNYCSGRDVYIRYGEMIAKEEAYHFLYSED